jgi:H+-transporting ATPase
VEAARRVAQYGSNELVEKERSPLLTFLGYFWGPYLDLTTRALIMLLHAGDRER